MDLMKEICQELDEPLKKDSVYQFSIYLAKSNIYESPSNVFDGPVVETLPKKKKRNKKNKAEIFWPNYVSYANSTMLSVWGGLEMCSTDELLFETTAIDHEEWKEYIIEFTPTRADMNHISLEAYFPNDSIYTRGNLMIDYINFEFSK